MTDERDPAARMANPYQGFAYTHLSLGYWILAALVLALTGVVMTMLAFFFEVPKRYLLPGVPRAGEERVQW